MGTLETKKTKPLICHILSTKKKKNIYLYLWPWLRNTALILITWQKRDSQFKILSTNELDFDRGSPCLEPQKRS